MAIRLEWNITFDTMAVHRVSVGTPSIDAISVHSEMLEWNLTIDTVDVHTAKKKLLYWSNLPDAKKSPYPRLFFCACDITM